MTSLYHDVMKIENKLQKIAYKNNGNESIDITIYMALFIHLHGAFLTTSQNNRFVPKFVFLL